MKSFLSFILTLTILSSSHGVIYQASNATPAEGWHCGMELCMCAHHEHGDPHDAVVDPVKNIYDGFYGSSDEQKTVTLSSQDNELLRPLEFLKKISALSFFQSKSFETRSSFRKSSKENKFSNLFSSDITKPPQR